MAKNSKAVNRRRFLKGSALAAGAAAGAVAMPQVSRAQTVTWKYQSTWPTKDIFHEFAADYANKVNEMSGGRLKLEVLAAGAVVPAFQMQDAVNSGILDGGHGVCAYWYGKHKAFSLFGTPPSWGWDAHGFLGWFYAGGGEALYNELHQRHPEAQHRRLPLLPDADAAARLVQEAGDRSATTSRTSSTARSDSRPTCSRSWARRDHPARRRNRAGAWTAACSTRPSSTTRRRTSCSASRTSSKNFMVQSNHQQAEAFEIIFNKAQVRCAAGRVEVDPQVRRVRCDGATN